MRRLMIWVLIFWGISCISLGMLAVVNTMPVSAQRGDDVRYEGASECRSCHRSVAGDHSETAHALTLQEGDEAVLADFEQEIALLTVQFPGEEEARPFTTDDIAYVVGAGRYVQRYLVEIDRDEYMVFPAEWDVNAQTWKPFQLAETWPDPAYDWTNNCAGCHTTGLNLEEREWWDDGVQCEACHGPGEAHIEAEDDLPRRPTDEDYDLLHQAIVVSPDAQVCGQCHSTGVATDGAHHFSATYIPGQNLFESFQLSEEASDPVHWWTTMSFNQWHTSGHATSLETLKSSSAAQDECLQCHSVEPAFIARVLQRHDDEDRSGTRPDEPGIANAQWSVTCIACHNAHGGEEEENPAEASYSLCTSCHQNTPLTATIHHPVKEMFEGQGIIDTVEGVPSVHYSQEEGPRCITCHMNGQIEANAETAGHTWTPALPDTCTQCHENLTNDDLLSLVDETQETVRSRLSIAWARVASISQPEAGSEAETMYQQVVTALTFVQNDGSQGVHNYAYTDALLDTTSGLLAQLSVPGANLQPTEAPAPTATPSEPQTIFVARETHVPTGVRPITVVILGAFALILLSGAFIIFRLSSRREK